MATTGPVSKNSTGPCKLVLSALSGLIKLDIDRGRRMPSDRKIDRRLARAGYQRVWITRKRSPSGKGWHVVLAVSPQPTDPREVVALQAVLGSDPAREACNLFRAKQILANPDPVLVDAWNVLYQ